MSKKIKFEGVLIVNDVGEHVDADDAVPGERKWIEKTEPLEADVDSNGVIQSLSIYVRRSNFVALRGLTKSFFVRAHARELRATGNRLGAPLPPGTTSRGFESLLQLRRVYLQQNSLTSLQPLRRLVNLTALDVADNELTSLDGLQLMSKLVILSAAGNQLRSLAPLMPLLSGALQSLDVAENPPLPIAAETRGGFRRRYARNQPRHGRDLNAFVRLCAERDAVEQALLCALAERNGDGDMDSEIALIKTEMPAPSIEKLGALQACLAADDMAAFRTTLHLVDVD